VNIFFIKVPSLFVDDIVISTKQLLLKTNKLFLVFVKILQILNKINKRKVQLTILKELKRKNPSNNSQRI